MKRQRVGVQVHVVYDAISTIGTPQAFFDKMREAGIRLVAFNPANPIKLVDPWVPITATIESFWWSMGMVAFTGGVNIGSAYTKISVFRSKSNSADEVERRDTDIRIEDPALAALQWEFLANAGDKLVRVMASTPDGDHGIYAACILAIDSAMGSVQIACVYFVPDVQVLKALTSAARCRRQDHSAKCHGQWFGGPRKALFL